MKDIRGALRDADPLRHEAMYASSQRELRRQAVLAVVSGAGGVVGVESQPRVLLFATAGLALIAATFLGVRVWSLLFVPGVQAAVRFEVRLAEDRPDPGLQKAKVSGSDRSVYLHDEVIVSNSDVASARLVQGESPSRYGVNIEFNVSGAEKMRVATGKHIGEHIAILLDGQVVMTPVLRSPIAASARITGNFTKAQAERIVNGIRVP